MNLAKFYKKKRYFHATICVLKRFSAFSLKKVLNLKKMRKKGTLLDFILSGLKLSLKFSLGLVEYLCLGSSGRRFSKAFGSMLREV